MSSTFNNLITYLSNAKLHDPCTTTRYSGGVSTTCGFPIKALGPGDVLVSWSDVSHPSIGPEIPEANMTVDGHPAHLAVTKPGNCAQLGAQETITVEIEDVPGNQFDMVACLRQPGVPQNDALVRRMVASTRVSR